MLHFTLKKRKIKHSFLVGFMQLLLLLQKVILGEGQQHEDYNLVLIRLLKMFFFLLANVFILSLSALN